MSSTQQDRRARAEAASAAGAMLGALGASKGGRARARKLPAERRAAIASKGGRAYGKLSKRKRTAASRRGWATRRKKAQGAQAPA